jgi:O-antigen/teichoic acid export membrane protein
VDAGGSRDPANAADDADMRPAEGARASVPERTTRARPPLVSSTFITLSTQVASSVFALANVFVIARSLGPSGRGEVALLMTISATLSGLGALGIQEANVNFASSNPELRRTLASNSIFLALVTGSAISMAAAALATVIPLFGTEVRLALIAFALASVPFLLLKVYFWRLIQADYRFGAASVSWALPYFANFVLNAALALAGVLTVTTAFASWLGAQLVPLVFLGWHISRRLGGFGRPSYSLGLRALKFGVQIHIYKIMSVGNTRLDQWILGVLGNTRELGLYSVAVALSTSLYQLPSALDLAQRPDLVRASKEEAARRASVVFRVAAVITGAGAVLIAVLAPYICSGIFGSDFLGAADDLRVLMLGTIGVVALKLLGNALTAQGRPLLVSVGVGGGFVVTIVLDILLIPHLGGLGAAIASAIAYTTVGIIVAAMFLRAVGGKARDLVPRRGDLPLMVAQIRRLLLLRRARRQSSPPETVVDQAP